MKIVVHDYGGYAFALQLAESLAKRKHSVQYIYSDTTQAIKRLVQHGEQTNLLVTPIVLSSPFAKYSLFKRRKAEIEHGKRVVQEIRKFQPEVVFSADAPLDAQKIILENIDRKKTKFVFWMQDAIGLASRQILSEKIPIIGSLIGRYYEALERRMVGQSDMVIVISEDFVPLMKRWNVAQGRLRVIHNWAPLEEIPVQPKQNPWSKRNSLAETINFLYTGILGFKHNPELFIQLAREFEAHRDVRIVVIAEGEASRWLKREAENRSIQNLILLPYQPAEEYAQVLGSGDVLISILNSAAGSYSVPSKVLSYLCAQRAVLLSAPIENLAAKIVLDNQAGLVCSPSESGLWLKICEICI